MAGPERAATVAALMSLIRSTSESPASDGGVLFFCGLPVTSPDPLTTNPPAQRPVLRSPYLERKAPDERHRT